MCSAHELAKGYTRPAVSGSFPAPVPHDVLQAHEDLAAKRKLTRILRSKSIVDLPVNVSDLVQIFIKHEKQKRGQWSSPKTILSFDKNSGTVLQFQARMADTSVRQLKMFVLQFPKTSSYMLSWRLWTRSTICLMNVLMNFAPLRLQMELI